MTGHRTRREGASGKEVAELKKQLNIAHRTIRRQQKQIQQYQNNAPEEEAEPLEPDVEEKEVACPHCGQSDFTEIDLPSGRKVTFCKPCKKKLV